MKDTQKINHGRETEGVYYGPGFVMKRPLPKFNEEQKIAWLEKQHKTKETIDEISCRKRIDETVFKGVPGSAQ